jgi:V8-like Glu-specific endopeptidase
VHGFGHPARSCRAVELNAAHPVRGTAIKVVSGYWKRIYSCSIDGFAYRLKEGQRTLKDSVRYTSSCNTIGGTSGSPVIDKGLLPSG